MDPGVDIGRQRQLDSIELLTFASALTRRVRLGVAVLLLALRAPVPLAKALITLDQLSAGRLIVGLGLGNPAPTNLAFGVHHPNALKRTVKYADGFIGAGGTPVAEFASEVEQLRHLLKEDGRDPDAFPMAKRVYIAVDNDKARAASRLAERLGNAYGGSSAQPAHKRIAVWGSAEECVEKLLEVVRAGAGLVLLTLLFDELGRLLGWRQDHVYHG